MPTPKIEWGPVVFSSGYNPKEIRGPEQDTHLVEHQIPGREGGIVEYVGSPQRHYQIRGFLSPPQDGPYNGTAAGVLSGTSYLAMTADDSVLMLLRLRGSGAQLLRIESTNTQSSGYSNLYENDFFYALKMTFGHEAGRTYPYYPYTLDLRRASSKMYGLTSGASVLSATSGNYFSGYVRAWRQISGYSQGEMVVGVALYINTVASGNAKVAIYNSGNVLQAESASQAVHSGWNYWPLRPSITTTSGVAYVLAFKGDVANDSGFTTLITDVTQTSGTSFFVSGATYSAAFPASFSATSSSGLNFQQALVTT